MDESSLSHTRWDCKYYIVLSPKYRRKEIYGKLKKDIGQILRGLCEHKGIEIARQMHVQIIYTCW
jgi:putative transposase